MMRDIKFRGINYLSEWVYGYVYSPADTNRLIINDFFVKEKTVGQFTGLHDKNGKEIYEGDKIILHQFLFDGEEFENELKGEIVYDNDTSSFALKNVEHVGVKKYMGFKEDENCGNIPIFDFYGLHEESFEVIGNIYEGEKS